jgi:hypothetical protein
MALKESAIARTTPPGTQATRYKEGYSGVRDVM